FPVGVAGLEDAAELGRDRQTPLGVHLDLLLASEPACHRPAPHCLPLPVRALPDMEKADRTAATVRSAHPRPISGPRFAGGSSWPCARHLGVLLMRAEPGSCCGKGGACMSL